MVKRKPFRRLEIDAEICGKLSQIIEARRYRGSFTSFVESVLDLYGDGLLKETESRHGSELVIGAGFSDKMNTSGKQRKAS